jgi:hypothetical protein
MAELRRCPCSTRRRTASARAAGAVRAGREAFTGAKKGSLRPSCHVGRVHSEPSRQPGRSLCARTSRPLCGRASRDWPDPWSQRLCAGRRCVLAMSVRFRPRAISTRRSMRFRPPPRSSISSSSSARTAASIIYSRPTCRSTRRRRSTTSSPRALSLPRDSPDPTSRTRISTRSPHLRTVANTGSAQTSPRRRSIPRFRRPT